MGANDGGTVRPTRFAALRIDSWSKVYTEREHHHIDETYCVECECRINVVVHGVELNVEEREEQAAERQEYTSWVCKSSRSDVLERKKLTISPKVHMEDHGQSHTTVDGSWQSLAVALFYTRSLLRGAK